MHRPNTLEGAYNGTRFSDILNDEEKMSRVFEEFLRNFYYYEQSSYSVSSEEMRWRVNEANGDVSLIPVMRTDITLRSQFKTIVMDAKFYADPFPLSYGSPKLRAGHLYQLYAYMKNAA